MNEVKSSPAIETPFKTPKAIQLADIFHHRVLSPLENLVNSSENISEAIFRLLMNILGKQNVMITLFPQRPMGHVIPTDEELKIDLFYTALGEVKKQIEGALQETTSDIQNEFFPIRYNEYGDNGGNDSVQKSDTDYVVPLFIGATQIGYISFLGLIQHLSEQNISLENRTAKRNLSVFNDGLGNILNGPLDRTLSATRKTLSETDRLTGILNRGQLFATLEQYINYYKAKGFIPGTVCMIDFDHFKWVNDNYGHAAGDEVLIQLTKVICSVLPDDAVFGRFGGEEFVVFLPNITDESALEFAEKVRSIISETDIRINDDTIIRRTVSIGVATLRSDDTSDSVIERADSALYVAKNEGGRNNVQFYKEDEIVGNLDNPHVGKLRLGGR